MPPCFSLENLLSTTKGLSEITDASLLKSVLEDVDFNRAAPEQYARLAAGLLVAFTRSFIDGKQAASEIYRYVNEREKKSLEVFKSMCRVLESIKDNAVQK